MADFFQTSPHLANTFKTARWLKDYLSWRLPKDYQSQMFSELSRVGEMAAGPLAALARQAEREKPVHVPYDPWGRRIDEIRISKAWVDLKDFSATEGLVAEGYERRFGAYSRLFQFSKLFLFHPSSAFFSCPLAMADGAARVLEIHGSGEPRLREAYAHLTSRQTQKFWTSGQWMTEKTGGSDVSKTLTTAKPDGDGYFLNGVKWFSSSTASEMALGLARIEATSGEAHGLTLFYIPVRLSDGALNGIEILRLKDKLGTWALPTAELKLHNTKAYPVGKLHHGVKTVSTMLNITRLYNSVCSVGQMARGLELLSLYAKERQLFGSSLSAQPLFQSTLFNEELVYLAGFLLTFKMCEFLGKEEMNAASAIELDLLRLFTPVTKMFTAKGAVRVTSEVVEGFGGAGYIEDTGIPTLYRDAQVFSIWEGATNVLSLDLMRVLQKTNALNSFFIEAQRILKLVDADKSPHAKLLQSKLENLQAIAANHPELTESARGLAFHLAEFYSALLMLEWASSDPASQPRLDMALKYWLRRSTPFELEPIDLKKNISQFFAHS